MLCCGDTFLTGDDDDDLHLWIAITPPTNGEVITVSVTTQRKGSEALVVLHEGDHPFIKHDSVIAYIYSRIRTVASIEAALLSGTAKQREPVSAGVLKRVQDGLLDSNFTPNGVRFYYKNLK